MEEKPPVDRRNRKWGSLQGAAQLRVRIPRRTKAILSALRQSEEENIGYGAVIEKLAEQHASLLGDREKWDQEEAAKISS